MYLGSRQDDGKDQDKTIPEGYDRIGYVRLRGDRVGLGRGTRIE